MNFLVQNWQIPLESLNWHKWVLVEILGELFTEQSPKFRRHGLYDVIDDKSWMQIKSIL